MSRAVCTGFYHCIIIVNYFFVVLLCILKVVMVHSFTNTVVKLSTQKISIRIFEH